MPVQQREVDEGGEEEVGPALNGRDWSDIDSSSSEAFGFDRPKAFSYLTEFSVDFECR